MVYCNSEDPPSPATAKAIQGLVRMVERYPDLKFLDAVQDLKVTDMNFVQTLEDKIQVENTLEGYNCLDCPHFQSHVCYNLHYEKCVYANVLFVQFEIARQKYEFQEKLENTKFMLSEDSLHMLPEYNQRLEVDELLVI